MTSPLGLGISPLGTGLVGFGTPSAIVPPAATLYKDANSEQVYGGAFLKLNQNAQAQYVYDANGNKVGQTDGHQLVTIAMATKKGTCADPKIGVDRNPRVINDSFVQDMKASRRDALASIEARGLITIDSITVEPNAGMPAFVSVRITDKATGQNATVTS